MVGTVRQGSYHHCWIPRHGSRCHVLVARMFQQAKQGFHRQKGTRFATHAVKLYHPRRNGLVIHQRQANLSLGQDNGFLASHQALENASQGIQVGFHFRDKFSYNGTACFVEGKVLQTLSLGTCNCFDYFHGGCVVSRRRMFPSKLVREHDRWIDNFVTKKGQEQEKMKRSSPPCIHIRCTNARVVFVSTAPPVCARMGG